MDAYWWLLIYTGHSNNKGENTGCFLPCINVLMIWRKGYLQFILWSPLIRLANHSTRVAVRKVIPTWDGQREVYWGACCPCLGSSSTMFKWVFNSRESERAYIHFHFIKIVYKYRAVGHIHSKALFWFECSSTREKEKPLHSVVLISTFRLLLCYWALILIPDLLAASYRDLDAKN